MKEVQGESGETYINLTEAHVGDRSGFLKTDRLFTQEEWRTLTLGFVNQLVQQHGDEYFPMGFRLIDLHREHKLSDTTMISLMRDLGLNI